MYIFIYIYIYIYLFIYVTIYNWYINHLINMGFPYMGDPQNGWFIMENPMRRMT